MLLKNLAAVAVLALVSLSANADEYLKWSDLDKGVKYHNAMDLDFGDGLVLKKDSPLLFLGSMGGPAIYLGFKNLNCTDPSLKSEMILFNPEPEDVYTDKSVGILMDENCEVSIYVEPNLFYSKSIFLDDK